MNELPTCGVCGGKGHLTPDDAERAIRVGDELFDLGYEAGKKMQRSNPTPPEGKPCPECGVDTHITLTRKCATCQGVLHDARAARGGNW